MTQVKRVRMTITVSPETRESLLRLNAASGTSISRLIEEFLQPEVLNSISEGLEMARSGFSPKDVSSRMSPILGRHVIAASETLKDFQKLGGGE